MRRILASVLGACLLFLCAGCGGDGGGYLSPEQLSKEVAGNTLPLYVDGYNPNGTWGGVGAQVDPNFLSDKVGRQQITREGMTYTPQASDWNEYILESMRAGKLQRIRMMLIDSYFCTSKEQYESKAYDWESAKMKDVYLILDTAEQLGIRVNVTFWGLQGEWVRTQYGDYWVRIPADNEEAEQACCDLFADAIDHLINDRGYTCINDVTLFNEPNIIYHNAYRSNVLQTFPAYRDLVLLLDQTFRSRGLRDRVKFCMSDDGQDLVWLEKSAAELSEVCEIFSTHTYQLHDDTSKRALVSSGAFRYELIREIADTYGVAIYFNEFGVDNIASDVAGFRSGLRGLTISRAMITSMNYGVLAYSFWTYLTLHNDDPYVLVSYNYTDEEKYLANQLYYAYSLFGRLTEVGSTVYYIDTEPEELCAAALRTPEGEWTYLAVNTSQEDLRVSFANCYEEPGQFNRYLYRKDGNYRNKEQIAADGTVLSTGRITETVIPAGALLVLSAL